MQVGCLGRLRGHVRIAYRRSRPEHKDQAEFFGGRLGKAEGAGAPGRRLCGPMLDRELRKGLKGQMRKIATINVAALGRQLVLQQEHCKQLWAEMCAQEQEYVERMQVGAPTAQALKKYERLRDQYLEEETRRMLLRGLIAEGGGEI